MFAEVSSNILEILNRELERLRRLKEGIPVNLQETAQNAAELVRQRIQRTGRNESGQVMTTQARQRIGRYSKGWGKRRLRAQRQIEHVDFTMTGGLMEDYGVVNSDSQNAAVGFKTDKSGEIADHLEQYFGPAFGLTPEERNRSIRGFMEGVESIYP